MSITSLFAPFCSAQLTRVEMFFENSSATIFGGLNIAGSRLFHPDCALDIVGAQNGFSAQKHLCWGSGRSDRALGEGEEAKWMVLKRIWLSPCVSWVYHTVKGSSSPVHS